MGSPEPERRKYKRITKHFILVYFDLAQPHERHEASQLRNISLGGMCLVTSQPFKPGSVLGIELKTPFHSEMTILEGKVLGSKEKIKDIIYETRMEFFPLDKQSEYVLRHLIDHFSKGNNRNE